MVTQRSNQSQTKSHIKKTKTKSQPVTFTIAVM